MQINHMSYEAAVKDLEAHPQKKLFWRSGWAWKGASEYEISRDPKDYPMTELGVGKIASWQDSLKRKYGWACVVECDKNTDEELHLNGLSELDME